MSNSTEQREAVQTKWAFTRNVHLKAGGLAAVINGDFVIGRNEHNPDTKRRPVVAVAHRTSTPYGYEDKNVEGGIMWLKREDQGSSSIYIESERFSSKKRSIYIGEDYEVTHIGGAVDLDLKISSNKKILCRDEDVKSDFTKLLA